MKRTSLLKTMLLLCALIVGSSSVWADAGDEITSESGIVSGKSYYLKGVYTSSRVDYTVYYGPTENDAANTKVTSGAVSDINSAMPITFTKVDGGWTMQTPNGNYIRPHSSNGQSYFVADEYVITIEAQATKSGSGMKFGPYTDSNYYIQQNTTAAKIGAYSSSQRGLTLIECGEASTDPSISASNVEIAYDDEEGSITYTINNPVDGGTLTASTEDDWLVLGDATTTSVPFICDANSETTARTATVTLTYTYNTTETVTKDITITQAGAPVVYTTIPALFAAATSTETEVKVTFNNWVVSGVSTNGKSVFVTDNNGNGFMIYSSSDQSSTYSVGDILSGTAVSCSLILYGGCAEITNLDASDLTITDGGTVSASNIAMADLAGVNTGALVSYDGLTCSVSGGKYYLTDGTTTIQLHNSLYAFEALESGHKFNITGIYQQYNDTKEILPRSADDIEELAVPVINADNVDIAYDATEGSITFTIDNPVDGGTLSASTEDDWITLGNETASPISFTCAANDGAARTATVTLTYTYNDPEETVTKDVTITQAKAPAPAVDGVFDFTYEDGIDYGTGLEPTTNDIKDAVTFTAGNVTLTPEPTVTNKSWRWYSASGSTPPTLRLYTDTKMTIAVPDGYVITNIDFVGTQNLNAVSVSSGKYEYATDKKSATWTGAAQSVVFTRNGSNPFYTKVTVTYTTANQPITISAAEYATYCGANALDFSETGIKVFTATDGETSVKLNEITSGKVPAGTPVVLYKAGADGTAINVPVIASADAIEGTNDLRVVGAGGLKCEETGEDFIYVLAKPADTVGFFLWDRTKTLNEGKIYLQGKASYGARSFLGFEEGNTTGVADINRETITNNGSFYNLNGQRVAQPTKGLYIVNGRKFVVK